MGDSAYCSQLARLIFSVVFFYGTYASLDILHIAEQVSVEHLRYLRYGRHTRILRRILILALLALATAGTNSAAA